MCLYLTGPGICHVCLAAWRYRILGGFSASPEQPLLMGGEKAWGFGAQSLELVLTFVFHGFALDFSFRCSFRFLPAGISRERQIWCHAEVASRFEHAAKSVCQLRFFLLSAGISRERQI